LKPLTFISEIEVGVNNGQKKHTTTTKTERQI